MGEQANQTGDNLNAGKVALPRITDAMPALIQIARLLARNAARQANEIDSPPSRNKEGPTHGDG